MTQMKLYSRTNSSSTSKTVKEEYKKLSGSKVDYSKYFMPAPKVPEYYTPNVKTDAEMAKLAKDRVQGIYDAYIKNSQMEKDFNVGTIRQTIDSLNPLYQERMGMLRDTYGEKERGILNDALSRGMGRSSYVEDAKSENSTKLAKGLSSLDLEKRTQEGQLLRDMERETLKYNQDKNKYNAQKNMEVNTLVAQMQREKDKALFDAQKYNDGLFQNYSKLVQQQQKHNLDVQKYIDSLNVKKVTVTTTTKSSTSSTYKEDFTVDRDRIMKLWNTLSVDDKVKYVRKNDQLLQSVAPDMFVKLNQDATYHVLKRVYDQYKPNIDALINAKF